ncbi:MAG TPA: hypothetical protein VFJ58_01150, partial [Armatimonadota bacterium]|nr:hypothetical protein [Armatimonadota bacterium]
MKRLKRREFLKQTGSGVGALALAPLFESAQSAAARDSKDHAYIRHRGNRWIFGTESVERVVALNSGRLLFESLKDRATGQEFAPPGPSEEFFVSAADGRRISSAEGPWTLVSTRKTRLKQGERQLDLTVRQGALQVTKSYVIYPGSSVIRESVMFTNTGAESLTVVEPGVFSLQLQPGGPHDFHWMTGGENHPDMWLLQTEQLAPGKPRQFDSYDPFPTKRALFPGDGIRARILQNDHPIWPANGWQYVPNATVTVPFDLN